MTEGALNEPNFWQPGVFQSERLVNMSHHNYRAEPNVRFSPDKKYVFFTSNMFGPSYIFGVEVAKAANPPAAEVQSTPELATQVQPSRTHAHHHTQISSNCHKIGVPHLRKTWVSTPAQKYGCPILGRLIVKVGSKIFPVSVKGIQCAARFY